MSRSRKKTPMMTLGSGGRYRKHAKRKANKRVKKSKDVANGKAYKKYSCSWDICDYKWRAPKPKLGGTKYFGREVSEKEMAKDYRKARKK